MVDLASRARDDDPSGPESTLRLIECAKAGDRNALERLLVRYGPRLRRWTHRRLPDWARSLSDTDDLVQVTLVRTMSNLGQFVPDGKAGFQNYLRRAMANAIRDEIRKARARPAMTTLDPAVPADEPSSLDRLVGRQRLERYEAALARLTPPERDAVVARLEFGFTHAELASVLGKNTSDAARKFCGKAIARLLTLMNEDGTPSD